MAICNFPKTSPPIGQTSTSCLQKFTIHFRRPDKLKQKKGAPPYRGEYGFDWLRDEYIYPVKKVAYDEVETPDNPEFKETYLELCKEPIKLRQEYLKDIEPSGKEFKLHGQDYYPAWLSIFACNVQSSNANPNVGSTMHKDGVYLDLQLDEIDEITDDRTEISFKPSVPCLKITPKKISISEFIKTTREKRILNNNIGQPEIYFYKLENAVRIICEGDTLKQHEQIKVFAKLGSTEYEVGRLMVYKNNNIGKADIFVVNVITDYDVNNQVDPKSRPPLDYLYKYQSFNQAMIRAEVRAIENFDLLALEEKTKDSDISLFLKDAKNLLYIDNKKVPDPEDPTKTTSGDLAILKRLSVLYHKYGKHTTKGIGLNEKKHHNSYLFFTTINSETVWGTTYAKSKSQNLEWGNVYMIFKNGLTDEHNIVHEAAHSFSLTHTFSYLHSPHVFQKGYTENYMDYPFHQEYSLDTYVLEIVDSEYKDKMYSFFKWQWDLMRNDSSIKK